MAMTLTVIVNFTKFGVALCTSLQGWVKTKLLLNFLFLSPEIIANLSIYHSDFGDYWVFGGSQVVWTEN